MCKRLIVSDGFYRAVQRDDVAVVTERIDRVEQAGVVTADGTLHELDVLVSATGFEAHAYMRPMRVVGREGRVLDDEWGGSPRAFHTVALPGYPNLFVLIGPHSPVGNFPLTAVAEWQTEHVTAWLQRWRSGEFTTVEPTEAATERFNDQIDDAFAPTVWASGCQSWYRDADGLPTVWPWSPAAHRRRMRRAPDYADYLFDGA
ncbi:hypothetical protein ACFVAV_12210 [Nocardia sp. NPDC057663]|uniref:hypothetical protein n=1 Tax=Nocardia sp. NPDC057663 TaxID=3346201 RepID=UPI003670706B